MTLIVAVSERGEGISSNSSFFGAVAGPKKTVVSSYDAAKTEVSFTLTLLRQLLFWKAVDFCRFLKRI